MLQKSRVHTGFAGKTEIEQALVDSIADAGVDYDNACEPHFDIAAGFVEGDKVKSANKVTEKLNTFFLSNV
jgi:hypothetical protein